MASNIKNNKTPNIFSLILNLIHGIIIFVILFSAIFSLVTTIDNYKVDENDKSFYLQKVKPIWKHVEGTDRGH
tara:strand:+ start:2059 stop:2277 length:219 start_codon:yes stop_codon:yes gene_type:complete